MNLGQLQAEVEAHGFDPNVYGARIINYLNDAYALVCRRVDYYIDEATYPFSTVANQINYPLPAGWARIRDVSDTTRDILIQPVTLRQLDNSGVPSLGPPQFYALDGANLHLWPTPDTAYTLQLRYWLMPTPLANATDIPTLPSDWHRILAEYASHDVSGGMTIRTWVVRGIRSLRCRLQSSQQTRSSRIPRRRIWLSRCGMTRRV